MADQQSQASLENQLRNMILTNVTIGSNSDPTRGHVQDSHYQNPRGRGRGRGRGRPYQDRGGATSWRGAGYRHQAANPTPSQHHAAPSSTPRILPRSHDFNRPHQNFNQSDRHHFNQMRGGPNPSMRGGHAAFHQRPVSDPRLQVDHLNALASQEVPKAEIAPEEFQEKETFRQELERICHEASIKAYAPDLAAIKLVMFGSLASGFATPGSDMDLAIVPEWKDAQAHNSTIERDIPRLLEQAILETRMGGRLLTRTRVPILKVCQHPTDELYTALLEEREKWDALPEEEKHSPPTAPGAGHVNAIESEVKTGHPKLDDSQDFPTLQEAKVAGNIPRPTPTSIAKTEPRPASEEDKETAKSPTTDGSTKENIDTPETPKEKDRRPRARRRWQRERKTGPLDFPKSGVGIQCDINFSNELAIHNTQLLRCYALTDPRVRPLVLFVKAWAKRRKINSAYSGTLSSYGWVLMVLHYLVNIAYPPVCPNLQTSWRPTAIKADELHNLLEQSTIGGYAVRFWRDEAQIVQQAEARQLTHNTQSVGELLRGFFHYYASVPGTNAYGQKQWCFFWATEVLSLRTPGGICRKEEKGWTRATTTLVDGKEVRQRYLFSIEDPFELDHNVARTVTHDGIVAIRDELRRAGRILNAIGLGEEPEGGLFDDIVEQAPEPNSITVDGESEPAIVMADGDAHGPQSVAGPFVQNTTLATVGQPNSEAAGNT